MERTESKIIQVSPSYENDKIQEMQHWGWSLQGRQEIHEQGDAEIERDKEGGFTVKKTIDKYVKLHFHRPMNLPNLNKLKQLEAEYDSLPFPGFPGVGWPIGLTIVFFFLGLRPGGHLVLLFAALCGFWTFKSFEKRKKVAAIHQQSIARGREILQEALALHEEGATT